MPLTAQTASRVVHFFDLEVGFSDGRSKDKGFNDFFSQIAYLSDSKDERRYQPISGKLLFVQDVRFTSREKFITGKIRAVRTDDIPELINMDTDDTREIERAEREGIVETTHFVVSYRNRNLKKIGVEYHAGGAKAHEFKTYLDLIQDIGAVNSIRMDRIVNGNVLQEVERRMGRVGLIHMRVPKDNIGQLQQVDGNLAAMFDAAHSYADTDAITIDLNFEAKRRPQTQQGEAILRNITGSLQDNINAGNAFESLTVKVEDTENNNKMQIFDLLSDKAKTVLNVNKKPNGAGLDSVDIFEKIAREMHRLNYL